MGMGNTALVNVGDILALWSYTIDAIDVIFVCFSCLFRSLLCKHCSIIVIIGILLEPATHRLTGIPGREKERYINVVQIAIALNTLLSS